MQKIDKLYEYTNNNNIQLYIYMQDSCTICQNEISLPYNLITCSHVFCFLCIKTWTLDGHMACPTCETFIDDNLDNIVMNNISDHKGFNPRSDDTIIFWVYSSAFNNVWWLYNDSTTKHIETIYQDYVKRQNMELSTDSDEIDVILDKNTNDNEKNVINYDQFAQIAPKDVSNHDPEFDMVSFSNDDNTNSGSNTPSNAPLSYIIEIGTSKYKIDFDAMKQINTVDSNKQRGIKRIEINEKPENINMEDLHQNYNIIGMAGIKFIK